MSVPLLCPDLVRVQALAGIPGLLWQGSTLGPAGEFLGRECGWSGNQVLEQLRLDLAGFHWTDSTAPGLTLTPFPGVHVATTSLEQSCASDRTRGVALSDLRGNLGDVAQTSILLEKS